MGRSCDDEITKGETSMTVVVMSNELIRAVVENINRRFHDEHLKVAKPEIPLPQSAKEVMRLLYGDNAKKVEEVYNNELLKDFFATAASIYICDAAFERKSHFPAINIIKDTNDRIPIPTGIPRTTITTPSILSPYISKLQIDWSSWRSEMSVKLFVFNVHEWTPILEPCHEYADARLEIDGRQQASVSAAEKIMRSHRTLSPVLREWPSLWEFLPEYAKNKHAQKSQRKSSDSSMPAIDESDKAALEQLDLSVAVQKMKDNA
jgi:hypothetical protein